MKSQGQGVRRRYAQILFERKDTEKLLRYYREIRRDFYEIFSCDVTSFGKISIGRKK